MRKLIVISLAFAFALCFAGIANADLSINSSDNAVIIGGHMGPKGITPMMEVIKVKDADTGTGTSEGMAMYFDTTAADGYTVKRMTDNSSTLASTQKFAGVMVTKTSKDSATYGAIGYMCIRGLCQANVTSTCTQGQALVVTGAAETGSLSTVAGANANPVSQDVGICIGAAGDPRQVWLR